MDATRQSELDQLLSQIQNGKGLPLSSTQVAPEAPVVAPPPPVVTAAAPSSSPAPATPVVNPALPPATTVSVNPPPAEPTARTPRHRSLPPLQRKTLLLGIIALIIVVSGSLLAMNFFRNRANNPANVKQEMTLSAEQPDQAVVAAPLSDAELTRAAAQDQERAKPSLIFANGVAVSESQRLQIVLTQGETEVMRRGGFGAEMAVEMLVEPGTYFLQLVDAANEELLLRTAVTFDPNEIIVLLRKDDGTATGQFHIEEISHQNFPVGQMYNLSKADVTVAGGTLAGYNVNRVIKPNASLRLPVTNASRVTFIAHSSAQGLQNKIFDFPNEARQNFTFFVFDTATGVEAIALQSTLAEQFRAPLLSQEGAFDGETAWCEGVWTCRVAQENCSSCGKMCLPTPDVCSPTANGGAGEQWNGEKTEKPST